MHIIGYVHICAHNSIIACVRTYLYSAQALTWHEGCIPEEEIWLKIGGDKGGGS